MRPNGFTKAWIVWVVGAVASFTLIEVKAMREPGAATLTSHLYHLGGFDSDKLPARLRRAALYAAWGWLPLHVHRHARRCVSCMSAPNTSA